jgi:hypothetical protein
LSVSPFKPTQRRYATLASPNAGIAGARDVSAGENGARNSACTMSGRTSSFHCASSSLYLTHEIRQAVDADLRQLAEFVDDLLGRSYQGVAAVTRDEMRLVSVQGLGVQGLIVQPENLQEIAGRLPVTLLVNVVT